MNFSTLQKMPLGKNKKKEQLPSPYSTFPKSLRPQICPYLVFFDHDSDAPTLPELPKALPWYWEPNTTWTFMLRPWKTLVFWVQASEQASSRDAKVMFIQMMRRLPVPVFREIWLLEGCGEKELQTTTGSCRIFFFLEEMWTTKWDCFILYPPYSKCTFFLLKQ